MPQRQTFTNNSMEISYLQWSDRGMPLLLLHGMADHALVWSSLGDYLSSNYQVIAPDLRGHGESGKPATGYHFQDYIGDLRALINHLGWTQAHILGHSWSAKIAAIWATQQPEVFKSLILVDPFFIDKMPSWIRITFPILYQVLPFLKITRSFDSYQSIEAIARQLKQYKGWSNLQQEVFKNAIEQKADGSWSSKFTLSARGEIFEDVMGFAGLTKTLDIPSLLILPQQGLNRTAWQIQSYKKYLTSLEIKKIPGNHWAFLGEPEIFNQAVAEFLSVREIV
ncbi:MAG: alpha/beta fold hydrolase [Microcystis sp.]|jgi:pimeloyl-ACP methyl ester carboxylesterase|uniref:alpha/beta fold hydrolase n=1 Tax=unclassified Microcystis TaxID=2643300 RepID=UPI0011959CBE|nr:MULTISPECIES: alpha/beta hydrolase [unclassified Microcystis]MCU7243025.1 alpha/beta hydrolase [Microcystis aeruginosa WS75]NCR13879.1 alpha/beta hydrolase [Microcystis aeruginosa SX13-11]NCR16603.1 alpha/beta hydrolase [Microcystis aeruginosa LL13-03]NCR36826.1 alpha/beta hydrolase [Microcystis aeruginosa S11-05]NCR44427.1 alpha/beta hydrolase [Microcystis aeruginosa SX13-01]NCR50332.1 alpha/beta hydrolase [Microcystis aeruginosa S11-01]NCR65655.1 alpha/beta hydrolase [Microcystis aerugi